MAGVWKLEEARLVQYRSAVSAADALSIGFAASPVPAGKLWCVLGIGYAPSAAETRTVSFDKTTSSGLTFGLLNPISLALNPMKATFIEQGMEYLLLPGEYITVRRDDHTAGSFMYLDMEFVEIDLPLYTYDEPQLVKRQERALSSIRARLGGGLGGARGIVPPSMTGERGGRGGPLPK